MILAAGLGTRLRPLTSDRPKALVTIAGRTMLELTIARLKSFGVNEIIINTHHFADLVAQYLEVNHNFGMRIELSREEILLDTGGGLKRAAHFFWKNGGAEPFLLHNVDILSTIDLGRMIRFHVEQRALATLAVEPRKTSRYLLFDEEGKLCGRQSGGDAGMELVRPVKDPQALAFSGIHVLSPAIFEKIEEEGVFSIVTTYLRLAAQGETIAAFRAGGCYWRDLGSPENVLQASQDIENGTYPATAYNLDQESQSPEC
jgi:NDP-sugar pyrophosphorylase family protein